MNVIEQVSIKLRHSPALARATWLWDALRPAYDKAIELIGRNGLERNFNGTDRMLLQAKFRSVSETYEPETWALLRSEVKEGDSVADVGSYIGLYTVALAKLVGQFGRVYAFEPSLENFREVQAHVKLNSIADRVELVRAALGNEDGDVAFDDSGGIQGHVSVNASPRTSSVPCIRLDTFLAGRALDILKLDVEGYEELVLKGANDLLSSTERKPRALFIEVHPYAWSEVGTSSASLLSLLSHYGYEARDLEGERVSQIVRYGEIVAWRIDSRRSG